MKNSKLMMVVCAALAITAGVLCAQSVYRYKCTRCYTIYSYSMPGGYTCPNDGTYLTPAR